MLELTKMEIPDCLMKLPKLLMDRPEILMVLDVFHRLCIRSNHPESVAPYRRPTINMDSFNDLTKGTTTRYKAVKRLLEMNLPTHLARFVNALIPMIEKLPCVPLVDDMNQAERNGRYIDPFLSGLFDEPDNNMFLRGTYENTTESRMQPCPSTSRPDLSVTSLIGDKWNTNHAYEKVKSAEGGANYLLCYVFVVSGIIEDDKNDSKKVNFRRFIIKDHLLLYKRSYISYYVFAHIRKRNKR
jgi:hypothetical protein